MLKKGTNALRVQYLITLDNFTTSASKFVVNITLLRTPHWTENFNGLETAEINTNTRDRDLNSKSFGTYLKLSNQILWNAREDLSFRNSLLYPTSVSSPLATCRHDSVSNDETACSPVTNRIVNQEGHQRLC